MKGRVNGQERKKGTAAEEDTGTILEDVKIGKCGKKGKWERSLKCRYG